MPQYVYQLAHELAKLIREKQATSVDIVKEHVTRIKERNGELNAFVNLFQEEALAVAAERDQQAKQGRFLGPLHGVPVSIKEQFWIKGKSSTINAKMHKDFVAPEDAVIVDRIRKGGAVILGHTNVPRFLVDYQVWGDFYPEGKNPYNTDCTPGGSTGGGAAAVAAGFSPLELGADLGGSVRNPANFCGLYGLKPTDNTVPRHGHLPLRKNAKTMIWHMAQAGPFGPDARRHRDPMEGHCRFPRERPEYSTHRMADPPEKRSLPEYKIAWMDGWPEHPVSERISGAIQAFVGKLDQHGCKVTNVSPGAACTMKLSTCIWEYCLTSWPRVSLGSSGHF